MNSAGPSAPQLRVLFVNRPDTFSLPGGDTDYMLRLKRQLEARGVQVTIDISEFPDPDGYDLVNVFNLLLPVHTVRHVHTLRARTQVPVVLTPFYWDTRESIWGEWAVQLAVAGSADEAALHAALRQIAAGTYPVHGRDRSAAHRPYADYEHHQRLALESLDGLILSSAREHALLSQRFPAAAALPAQVIPIGVATDQPAASPELFTRAYGLTDFVLVTGRVEGRKNQLMLLLALRDVDVPVVIAGAQPDPTYLALCQRVASPQTHFVGHLPAEMLASARAAARVHALPSWWECGGISHMEAALADCNIVVGDRAAETEYFGQLAYACDPADVASIRQAVLDAYRRYPADASRRRQLRERLHAQFNWNTIGDQTLAYYQACLAAEPRPAEAGARRARRELAAAHIALARGNAAEALLTLLPYLEGAEAPAFALELGGMVALQAGVEPQGLTWLQQAVQRRPDSGPAVRALAQAWQAAGDHAQALQTLTDWRQANPDDFEAQWLIARLHLARADWPAAVRELEALLARQPHWPQAAVALGLACRAAGRPMRAQTVLRQAQARLDQLLASPARLSRSAAVDQQQLLKVLESLLSEPNLEAAVRDYAAAGRLTPELLALVDAQARQAHSRGETAAAQALEHLARQAAAAVNGPAGGAQTPAAPADFSPAAVATLQALLAEADLAAALAKLGDRLTPELVALVQLNAATARADGHTDLAGLLEGLADHLQARLTGRLRAEAVFARLTQAPKLAEALEANLDQLDQDLVDLLNERAAGQRAAGDPAAAEALETLAGYITQLRQAAQPAAPAPAEVLEKLLEAEDLPAALAHWHAHLTPELLALVRANAVAAAADGDLELAEGLEALAGYIAGVTEPAAV